MVMTHTTPMHTMHRKTSPRLNSNRYIVSQRLQPFNAAKANLYIQPPRKPSLKNNPRIAINSLNRFALRSSDSQKTSSKITLSGVNLNLNSKTKWVNIPNVEPQRKRNIPSFTPRVTPKSVAPSRRPISCSNNSNIVRRVPPLSIPRKPLFIKPTPVLKSKSFCRHGDKLYTTPESNKKLLSARRNRINDLQSKIDSLERSLAEAKQENKTLRQQTMRQESALDRAECNQVAMPSMASRHSEEVRSLQQQLRNLRETSISEQRRNKQLDSEVLKLRQHVDKYQGMVAVGNIQDQNSLLRQTTILRNNLEKAEKKIKDLERHMENLKNNHKHELASEITKCREVQRKYDDLADKMNKLDQALKEKNKLVYQQNIYSHRLPHHRLSDTTGVSLVDHPDPASVVAAEMVADLPINGGPAGCKSTAAGDTEGGGRDDVPGGSIGSLVTMLGGEKRVRLLTPSKGGVMKPRVVANLTRSGEVRSVRFADVDRDGNGTSNNVSKTNVIDSDAKLGRAIGKVSNLQQHVDVFNKSRYQKLDLVEKKKLIRQERGRRLRGIDSTSGAVAQRTTTNPADSTTEATAVFGSTGCTESAEDIGPTIIAPTTIACQQENIERERAKKDNMLAGLQALDMKPSVSLLDSMLRNDSVRSTLKLSSSVTATGGGEPSPVESAPPFKLASLTSGAGAMGDCPRPQGRDQAQMDGQEMFLMKELFGSSASTGESLHFSQPSLRVIPAGKLSFSGETKDLSRNQLASKDESVVGKFPNLFTKYSTPNSSSNNNNKF